MYVIFHLSEAISSLSGVVGLKYRTLGLKALKLKLKTNIYEAP